MPVSQLLKQEYIPATWWDGFKAVLPEWIQKRYPVRYKLNCSISSRELSEWAAYFNVKEEVIKEQEKNAELARKAERLRTGGR